MENTIADGASRWNPEAIDGNLRAFRPDVAWHRLGTVDAAICSGALAASSSTSWLRHRLTERTYTSSFRSWAVFRGLIGEAEYFDAAVFGADKVQALLEFVAWCVREGNQAGTITEKNRPCYTSTVSTYKRSFHVAAPY